MMDLFYVPSGPRDQSIRSAVNRHIRRHVRARKNDVQMPWRKAHLAARVSASNSSSRKRRHSEQQNRPILSQRDPQVPRPSLRQHRLEPLQLLHENFTDPLARRLFHHCTTVFWPKLIPGRQSHLLAWKWIPVALAEPALFHSFMWGATLHISIKGRTLIRHPSLVRQHYNAVQLLNAEFSKGITGVRDTLLLSIVAFLTHEIEATDVFEATDEGFQPTFADLQLLDVYSRRPFVQTH